MTELSTIVPFLAGIIGVAIGSLLTHYFGSARDVASKRREMILENLITALEEFNRASSNRPDTDLKQIERAVTRVQMFGEKYLVDLANKAIVDLSTKSNANLTEIVVELRDKIRRELKLEPIPKKYMAIVIRYPGDPGFDEEKKKKALAGEGVHAGGK